MNFRLNAKTAGLALFLLFAAKNALPVDGYFTGDGLEGKRILVYSSSVENGNDSDAWLAQKTKRDIINDLVNYSNMDIIDADEKRTIRKLQKDSISGLYSDSDPIELGKMIQAKSYIKLVTSCKRKTYSLSATITNIETGKTEGSGSTPFYSEDDFISKAHGEIAAGILETLGVKLTIAGKRLLQYGTFSQTESESRENIAAYKAELARLEKEQQALRQTRKVQVDSEALNARIEAQKALLLQKQKNEEARLIRLREDAKSAVDACRALGLEVWMISGDKEETARRIAGECGIENVLFEVKPEEKAAQITQLKSEGRRVAMVGDGINDAPAMAEADLAIAMGTGTDIAIECADAVLPGGRIGRVPQALRLAGAARRTVRQNLGWALFYNLICIPVAACGIVNPSIAAAAMTLSSNGILLHSLRLNKAEASNENGTL